MNMVISSQVILRARPTRLPIVGFRITESDVMKALRIIVLSSKPDKEKLEWLEWLGWVARNNLHQGWISPVIEEIMNEEIHLMYTCWRGRHRNWKSITEIEAQDGNRNQPTLRSS